jgi:hypothetical protein
MNLQLLLSYAHYALAFRPGIPPQKFDSWMCTFYRTINGTLYEWALPPLAANAGSEYIAWKDGCDPSKPGSGDSTVCPSTYDPNFNYQDIVFNVCGTVSTAIAEMVCTGPPSASTCYQKPAPRPHSHGVVVQFIEKAAPLPGYTCVDMDSCDSATNFDPTTGNQCGIGPDMTVSSVGSLNYPANANENPLYPGAPFSNPRREATCQSNPNYDYCETTGTPCTGQAEVLAYYDGSAPTFALNDEVNPRAGVNLTYAGALPYLLPTGETDRCPQTDPATGYNVQRYVNIFIGCDENVKAGSPLAVDKYTERGQCQYYIEARSALACGAGKSGPSPSAAPAAPAATVQPTALVVGTAFGGAFAGVVAVAAAVLCARRSGGADASQPLLRASSATFAVAYGATEAGGARAPGARFCAACGAERELGGRFCSQCRKEFAPQFMTS